MHTFTSPRVLTVTSPSSVTLGSTGTDEVQRARSSSRSGSAARTARAVRGPRGGKSLDVIDGRGHPVGVHVGVERKKQRGAHRFCLWTWLGQLGQHTSAVRHGSPSVGRGIGTTWASVVRSISAAQASASAGVSPDAARSKSRDGIRRRPSGERLTSTYGGAVRFQRSREPCRTSRESDDGSGQARQIRTAVAGRDDRRVEFVGLAGRMADPRSSARGSRRAGRPVRERAGSRG